jgi:hypothetical protein
MNLMKNYLRPFVPAAVRLVALALMVVLAENARAAGPFTVTTVNDSHASNPGSSATDANGNISLRSAIEAANVQAGATTINVPPGTYDLALGELDVATNAGKNITIQAAGGNAANTVISQLDGTNRVFNIDTNSLGNDIVTLSGFTIQGGHDKTDIAGGAGILAGSVTNIPKDVLYLTGCVIANNHCSPPNILYTAQIGGGVQMAGGDLNINSCTFSNNSSGASQGGAIAFYVQSVNSSLTISNSIFANNSMTNTSGSGPDGGGAIFIGSTPGSVHTISKSVFSNNQAIGTLGNTYGGAIELNTGTLNINNSTFTGNAATSITTSGGQGGAIYVDAGTNQTSFCRIVGNSAPNGGGGIYNHGSNGANTLAINDWWGCNGGPGAAGCDVAATDAGGLNDAPFIVLTNTATPFVILPGQTTTLTASFLQNSAGTVLTLGQISVLLGLPVTWNNAVLGTIANPQTVIQNNGTATAMFIAGTTNGTGQASATVDNGIATALIDITCPGITGTVSGGGSICPGGSAPVTVSVSGGVPPYTITLNNGGGTQSGSSPFSFTVSPVSTTTYQLASGSDSDGCPVAASGSAMVTFNGLPTASITPSPTAVFANSSGNQASAPSGFAGYAWTINNGFIIGPDNLPTVNYIAGVSGDVDLSLTGYNAAGCSTNVSINVPVLTGFSVHTNLTFTTINTNSLGTLTGIAFDGTNYWDCSGGNSSGIREGEYTSSGAPIANFAAGLDFRSVFTRADGTVLARQYNDNVIYQQTNPGVFVNSGVSLGGTNLDFQSSVVLNGAGTEFDAMSGGVVSRWDTNGNYLGSVNLQGFGSLGSENLSPQNRGLAAFGDVWLTYNGAGILSGWDYNGNRVFQMNLPGAGTSGDSDWSFSCCNGKVFIVDNTGVTWDAFDLASGATVAVLGAESYVPYVSDVTNKIAGVGPISRVDFIRVTTGDPLPAPAQLRSYQSVLVFSDYGFNDNVGLGNELADCVDQGGGVVLNTFDFFSSGVYSIQGRLTNGYLPFTTSGDAAPGNLTLVADLPLNPLLDGVNSFNGGTESFLNTPISIAPGATQVAHWNNGQPLVGSTNHAPGRVVGLNFFPPSSDASAGFWVSSTDGAKLMVNALLWSGRIPPTIISAPADQVVAVGGTATFGVVAAGMSPLTYQWQLNGTNLPAATSSVLSFTVGASSPGQYSVVVSNPYGQTVSGFATLNLPLRFLTPGKPIPSALQLVLTDSDGSVVSSNRAARVQIYATTSLKQPFSQWLLVTNPVIATNGLLQVNGLTTTSPASRFFRAVEIP